MRLAVVSAPQRSCVNHLPNENAAKEWKYLLLQKLQHHQYPGLPYRDLCADLSLAAPVHDSHVCSCVLHPLAQRSERSAPAS